MSHQLLQYQFYFLKDFLYRSKDMPHRTAFGRSCPLVPGVLVTSSKHKMKLRDRIILKNILAAKLRSTAVSVEYCAAEYKVLKVITTESKPQRFEVIHQTVFHRISKQTKRVENATRRGVFLTKFEVLGNMVKHCLDCSRYLLNRNKFSIITIYKFDTTGWKLLFLIYLYIFNWHVCLILETILCKGCRTISVIFLLI